MPASAPEKHKTLVEHCEALQASWQVDLLHAEVKVEAQCGALQAKFTFSMLICSGIRPTGGGEEAFQRAALPLLLYPCTKRCGTQS